MKLLHVSASPSRHASRSRTIADHFTGQWRSLHPEGTVERLDVWSRTLPAFDATMIAAKFAVLRKQSATAQQRALWNEAVSLAREFNSADRYVISVPMWNFGLPYRLKHFIDVVTLPEENWRWSPVTGYEGLLSGKRALVVYSSAGDHRLPPHESADDHQKGQMRSWLRFLGIHDIRELNLAPTLVAPDVAAVMIDEAMSQAESLARAF